MPDTNNIQIVTTVIRAPKLIAHFRLYCLAKHKHNCTCCNWDIEG